LASRAAFAAAQYSLWLVDVVMTECTFECQDVES